MVAAEQAGQFGLLILALYNKTCRGEFLIVRQYKTDLLPILKKVLFKQRQNASFEHLLQRFKSLVPIRHLLQRGEVCMADTMVAVVEHLDALVYGIKYARHVDHLLAQINPQACERRSRFIASIRHHRLKLESAAQRGI